MARNRIWLAAAVAAAACGVGCNQSKNGAPPVTAIKPQPDKPAEPGPAEATRPEPPAAPEERPQEPAEEATDSRPSAVQGTRRAKPIPTGLKLPPAVVPVVHLTQGHRQTCKVGVGDTFPSLELADAEGKRHALESLRGSRLTVVVWWNSQNPLAVEEIADLGPDVMAAFGEEVKVVGINVGESADTVRQVAAQTKAEFPLLLDADGAALAQVATGKLPRTYLLDAAGKVLWFDLEYSRSTRRELNQALRYVMRP